MYQYLVSKGIDPHRLYQEDKSTSTRENILFSYQLIKKENLPKAITIITNEFHEYRAQTIAPVSYTHLDVYKRQTQWRLNYQWYLYKKI